MQNYKNSLNKIKRIQPDFNQENLCSVFSNNLSPLIEVDYYINKSAVCKNNIITINDYSTTELKKNKEGRNFLQLYCRDISNVKNKFKVTILGVLTNNKIQVESVETIPDKLYILGQVVKEEPFVERDDIYKTGIVAIQELDNKFQKLELEIRSIHSELKSIDAQLQTLVGSFNNKLKGEKVHELQEKVNTNRSGLRKMII